MQVIKTILETPIRYIFERLVSNFIQNDINFSNFGLGSVHNLKLNSQKINELLANSPFQISDGQIGEAQIDIPWKNLLTQSVVVNIKDLSMNLTYNLQNYYKKQQDVQKEEIDVNSFKQIVDQILYNMKITIQNVTITLNLAKEYPAMVFKMTTLDLTHIPDIELTIQQISCHVIMKPTLTFNESDPNTIMVIGGIKIKKEKELQFSLESFEIQLDSFQLKSLSYLIENLMNLNPYKQHLQKQKIDDNQNNTLLQTLIKDYMQENDKIEIESIYQEIKETNKKQLKLNKIFLGNFHLCIFEKSQENVQAQYKRYWKSLKQERKKYCSYYLIDLNNITFTNDANLTFSIDEIILKKYNLQQKEDLQGSNLFKSFVSNNDFQSFMQLQSLDIVLQEVESEQEFINKDLITIKKLTFDEELSVQSINLQFDFDSASNLIDLLYPVQNQNWGFRPKVEDEMFKSIMNNSSIMSNNSKSFIFEKSINHSEQNPCLFFYNDTKKPVPLKLFIQSIDITFEELHLTLQNILIDKFQFFQVQEIKLQIQDQKDVVLVKQITLQETNNKSGEIKSENFQKQQFYKYLEDSDTQFDIQTENISFNLLAFLDKLNLLQTMLKNFKQLNEKTSKLSTQLSQHENNIQVFKFKPIFPENKVFQNFVLQKIFIDLTPFDLAFYQIQILMKEKSFMFSINKIFSSVENLLQIKKGLPFKLVIDDFAPAKLPFIQSKDNQTIIPGNFAIVQTPSCSFCGHVNLAQDKAQINLLVQNLSINFDFQFLYKQIKEKLPQKLFEGKKENEQVYEKSQFQNKLQFSIEGQNICLEFKPHFCSQDLIDNPQIIDQAIPCFDLKSGNYFHPQNSILLIDMIKITQNNVFLSKLEYVLDDKPLIFIENLNLQKTLSIESVKVIFEKIPIAHFFSFQKFLKNEKSFHKISTEIELPILNVFDKIKQPFFQQSSNEFQNEFIFLNEIIKENEEFEGISIGSLKLQLIQDKGYLMLELQAMKGNIKGISIDKIRIKDEIKDSNVKSMLEGDQLKIFWGIFENSEIEIQAQMPDFCLFVNLNQIEFLKDFFKNHTKALEYPSNKQQENHFSDDLSMSMEFQQNQDKTFVRLIDVNPFILKIDIDFDLNISMRDITLHFPEIYYIGNSLNQTMGHIIKEYKTFLKDQHFQIVQKIPLFGNFFNLIENTFGVVFQTYKGIRQGQPAQYAFFLQMKNFLKAVSYEGLNLGDFLISSVIKVAHLQGQNVSIFREAIYMVNLQSKIDEKYQKQDQLKYKQR